MADDYGMIASAVIVPETIDRIESPSGIKRRQSSASESGSSKRPRISAESSEDQHHTLNGTEDTARDIQSQKPTKDFGRRKSGQDEERQRGKRLFGALLGTLSQSSPSSAQKRRADIDRKQRAKLRVEAEEFGERQRQERQDLLLERRKAQKKWDEQSMLLRHSNMLATANFLKTEAYPALYYLPWEIRSEDKRQIDKQLQEVNQRIGEELEVERQKKLNEVFDGKHSHEEDKEIANGDQELHKQTLSIDVPTQPGTDTELDDVPPAQPPEPNLEAAPASEHEKIIAEETEELDVEADACEDPVIY